MLILFKRFKHWCIMNKGLFIHLGLLYLFVILTYKIPHDSRTIIEALIKPIKNGGVFYPSTIVATLLILFGLFGFIRLKCFEKRSKILIFMLVVWVILPSMKWSIDFTRSNYYWIKQDNLNAIDIEDANISLSGVNGKNNITITLTLKDYGRDRNQFKFRVYFPEALSQLAGMEVYESQGYYVTSGYRRATTINESFQVSADNMNDYRGADWFCEDIRYEIFNDDEAVVNIDRGY